MIVGWIHQANKPHERLTSCGMLWNAGGSNRWMARWVEEETHNEGSQVELTL